MSSARIERCFIPFGIFDTTFVTTRRSYDFSAGRRVPHRYEHRVDNI